MIGSSGWNDTGGDSLNLLIQFVLYFIFKGFYFFCMNQKDPNIYDSGKKISDLSDLIFSQYNVLPSY